MEPFFTSVSLYDASTGTKLSEDIWLDGNPSPVWKMVKNDTDSHLNVQAPALSSSPVVGHNLSTSSAPFVRPHIVDSSCVSQLKEIVFSIPEDTPLRNLFIHVRIEKVLQGAIASSFEVYGKAGIDQEHKSVQKYLKQLHMFCQKFGSRFRTPFCWAAVPVPTVLSSTYVDE